MAGNMHPTVRQRREDIDRLSNLPKEIVYHILSFLPTKNIVQTSVLSKKWRFLWTSIRHIDLDERDFYFVEEDEDGDFGDDYDPVGKFIAFADTFFILYDGFDIEELFINCSTYCDISRVCTWIRAAVKYRVKELDLNLGSVEPFSLPYCLFTSNSLRELKLTLRGNNHLNLPSSNYLPNLTTLHLCRVKFFNNSLIHQLLSNCPILENLLLEDCNFDTVGVIDISVPTLKSLVIASYPIFNVRQNIELPSMIKINAPRLASFEYTGWSSQDFDMVNLSSLVDASLGIIYHATQDTASRMGNLFRALRIVKLLRLSSWTIECLATDYYLPTNFPVVNDLKQLNLQSSCVKSQLQGIIRFLQHAPNLESLQLNIIEVPHILQEDPMIGLWCLDFVPQHLKLVDIKNFYMSDNRRITSFNQYEFALSILKYAQCLERITIKLQHRDLEMQMQLNETFLLVPRASRGCVIEIRS